MCVFDLKCVGVPLHPKHLGVSWSHVLLFGVIFLGMPTFTGLLFEIVCKLVIILDSGVQISLVIVFFVLLV